MKDVYEELLGHLKDHVVVGKYLQGDIPEWGDIWAEAMPMLSSGEKIMFEIGLALFNGQGIARISDIYEVDSVNQKRIINALSLRFNQP